MKDETGRGGGKPRDLGERLKQFALDVIRFCRRVPRTMDGYVLARQLLNAGTSPGAHYREGMRAKSDADLVSKLEGALQELEEAAYWLELIRDSELVAAQHADPLLCERQELTAMLVSAVLRVKARHQKG